eukprot:4559033-Prymnesium_polylepis.1
MPFEAQCGFAGQVLSQIAPGTRGGDGGGADGGGGDGLGGGGCGGWNRTPQSPQSDPKVHDA